MIGTDILSGFDLDFDFPKRTLTFYQLKNCTSLAPPWQSAYIQIPIRVGQAKQIVIPVELDGHPLSAIFDTGCDGELLSMTSVGNVGLSSSQLALDPHVPNAGMGTKEYQQIPVHKFASLRIGSDNLSNVWIPIGTVNSREGSDMRIGQDYMHTKRFWLSYASNALFAQ
jgi:hypothetical protein